MIDAHQHCWQIGAHGCSWPTPDLNAIYRDFSIAELQEVAQPFGIAGSVLVQSQPCDSDTDYLLALAREDEFIKAVVGWVDLLASTAPSRIIQLAAQPKLRGLRPMLQALPADDWILQPAISPAIAAMIDASLSFDALVYPRHLPHLLVFAKRHHQLAVVIDHGAKPPIAANDAKQYQLWSDGMAQLADLPQVYCKISGLLSETAEQQDEEIVAVYVQRMLELFGPERLIWGSDWPVVNAAPNRERANYAGWLRMSKLFFAQLSAAEKSAVFGENARRFYRF